MNIDLNSKRALVGGSSKGIGLAIARQLAESGASVCLMARSGDRMREIVAELPTDQGQSHHFLVIDYEEFEDYSQKVKTYVNDHPIDILVNNTQGPPGRGSTRKRPGGLPKGF